MPKKIEEMIPIIVSGIQEEMLNLGVQNLGTDHQWAAFQQQLEQNLTYNQNLNRNAICQAIENITRQSLPNPNVKSHHLYQITYLLWRMQRLHQLSLNNPSKKNTIISETKQIQNQIDLLVQERTWIIHNLITNNQKNKKNANAQQKLQTEQTIITQNVQKRIDEINQAIQTSQQLASNSP